MVVKEPMAYWVLRTITRTIGCAILELVSDPENGLIWPSIIRRQGESFSWNLYIRNFSELYKSYKMNKETIKNKLKTNCLSYH